MMKFSQRTLSRGRSAIFAPLTAALVLLPAGLAGAASTPTKLLNGNGRFLVRPSQVGLPLGGRIHRTWKLGRCSPFPGGRYTYLWEPFLSD